MMAPIVRPRSVEEENKVYLTMSRINMYSVRDSHPT